MQYILDEKEYNEYKEFKKKSEILDNARNYILNSANSIEIIYGYNKDNNTTCCITPKAKLTLSCRDLISEVLGYSFDGNITICDM